MCSYPTAGSQNPTPVEPVPVFGRQVFSFTQPTVTPWQPLRCDRARELSERCTQSEGFGVPFPMPVPRGFSHVVPNSPSSELSVNGPEAQNVFTISSSEGRGGYKFESLFANLMFSFMSICLDGTLTPSKTRHLFLSLAELRRALLPLLFVIAPPPRREVLCFTL